MSTQSERDFDALMFDLDVILDSPWKEFDEWDPRAAATKAEMAYRRSPEGHLEAVANGTWVAKSEPVVVFQA